LVNAALWAALWSLDSNKRLLRFPAVLALTAIPPIGLVGWANPLTAAGVFFPATGFAGLFLCVGLMLAVMSGRKGPIALFATAAVAAHVSAALWAQTPNLPGWTGVDTSYGKLATGSGDFMAAYGRLQAVKGLAETTPAGGVLVLPETVLGSFGDAAEYELAETSRRLEARGATVLVGAEVAAGKGQQKNVLIALGAGHGQQLVQRVPIPIGMWKPWDSDSVVADPFAPGVSLVAGRKVGFLICYEQILAFPVLRSMLSNPDVLVGVANSWWARGTSAPIIQRQSMNLWGRLFALPVIQAFNI
jgi:Carbon-nitrogen hydrolase